MGIGATAKHVEQLVVVFINLCQQQLCPLQEEKQYGSSNCSIMVVHMGSHLYPQSTDTSYGRMDTIRIPRVWILTKFYTDFYPHYCLVTHYYSCSTKLISEIIWLHKLLSKTSKNSFTIQTLYHNNVHTHSVESKTV